MREEVDVGEDVLHVGLVVLEAEFKDVGGDLLVLGAVVLHERRRHEDVIRAAGVVARLLEDGARRRGALSPPAKLHVLDVALEHGKNWFLLGDTMLILTGEVLKHFHRLYTD